MLVKNTDYITKNIEIENKITTDHDHDKYITTEEFTKLTAEHSTTRLTQVNVASKNDIANFIKKTDLNKNELNELSKKVTAISAKGLTKDFIINSVFLIEQNILVNYLVHMPAKKDIDS